MNILVGIGNADRGDDGVGIFVAEHFSHPEWRVLNGGTAPENLAGLIRKSNPAHLVLVDAADMGLPPGAVRRIERVMIRQVGLGTHALPLDHLMDYLSRDVPLITFIGIQPGSTDWGSGMSEEALRAALRVMELLKDGRIDAIEPL